MKKIDAELSARIDAKRREIEASGFAQWEYAKPEDFKDCPACGGTMELVKAEDGGEIEEPFIPRYPLRNVELPRKRRPATFWACSACEHCEEVARG